MTCLQKKRGLNTLPISRFPTSRAFRQNTVLGFAGGPLIESGGPVAPARAFSSPRWMRRRRPSVQPRRPPAPRPAGGVAKSRNRTTVQKPNGMIRCFSVNTNKQWFQPWFQSGAKWSSFIYSMKPLDESSGEGLAIVSLSLGVGLLEIVATQKFRLCLGPSTD